MVNSYEPKFLKGPNMGYKKCNVTQKLEHTCNSTCMWPTKGNPDEPMPSFTTCCGPKWFANVCCYLSTFHYMLLHNTSHSFPPSPINQRLASSCCQSGNKLLHLLTFIATKREVMFSSMFQIGTSETSERHHNSHIHLLYCLLFKC